MEERDTYHAKFNNRDLCLEQLSSDRKTAKTAFLKVAYGGNIKLYNEFYNHPLYVQL